MNNIFSSNVELRVEKILFYVRNVVFVIYFLAFLIILHQSIYGDPSLMPKILRALTLGLFSSLIVAWIMAQFNDVTFSGSSISIKRYWLLTTRVHVFTLEDIEAIDTPFSAYLVLRLKSGKKVYIWQSFKMDIISNYYFSSIKTWPKEAAKLLSRYILERRDFYRSNS